MNYHAAIFDMDGLLLDTERISMQTFSEACSALSLPMLKEVYLKVIGCNATTVQEIICSGYGSQLDYQALRSEWLRRYHGIVTKQAIPIKEGVVELMQWLKSESIPIAVATSSDKEIATIKLTLAGLIDYVDCLSTGCEVTKSKPDPEIFLLAAARLQVPAQQCLAFEDSHNGVLAAVAAGMQVYQVPDLIPPSTELIAMGHHIHSSLADVLHTLQSQQIKQAN
ncbi:HAD family phosphatase [Psychromonas sp. MME2]